MKTIALEKTRLLEMLNSETKDDHILAYSIINELDIVENIGEILLILKSAGIFSEEMTRHIPNLYKVCPILKDMKPYDFTFTIILSLISDLTIKNPVNNKNQISIVKRHIENLLSEHLNNLGFDFIEDIVLILK